MSLEALHNVPQGTLLSVLGSTIVWSHSPAKQMVVFPMKRIQNKVRFNLRPVGTVFPNNYRQVMSQRVGIQHQPLTQRPYRNNSVPELLNSYSVFSMCGIKPLVSSVPTLIKLSKSTKTDPLLYFVVKNTFFRHFCGN